MGYGMQTLIRWLSPRVSARRTKGFIRLIGRCVISCCITSLSFTPANESSSAATAWVAQSLCSWQKACAERRRNYSILLYTYGAPRAADSEFTLGASSLVHHRIVNHNDPVPSVPAPWMNTTAKLWIPGAVTLFSAPASGGLLFAAGLVRFGGNPYQHHGEQQHFMPIMLADGTHSSVLWKPGCESIQEAGCNRALQLHGDMPDRDNLLKQLFQANQHFMTASYIPAAWSTLRRWQQTQESSGPLVTPREFERLDHALETMRQQLRNKRRELVRLKPANDRGYEHNEALNAEIDRLHTSRERLATLRWRRLDARDVYGSQAHSASLQPSLRRWFSHPENRELAQVASIPPAMPGEWGGRKHWISTRLPEQSLYTNSTCAG